MYQFFLLASVLSEQMSLVSDMKEFKMKMKSFNITFILQLLCSFNVPWSWGGLWYGDVVILSKCKIEEIIYVTDSI